MLNKFREATQQLHQEIEQENLADLIISHQITIDQYKLLLLQNYIAYKVTEDEIAKHILNYKSDKTEKLKKDLTELNVPTRQLSQFINKFQCHSKPEAIGAQYVVEGSSLGGMMIAKNIKECAHLKPIEKHHFFDGDRKNVEAWKNFCKDLKTMNFSPEEEEQAIKKAQETFKYFGNVFQEVK